MSRRGPATKLATLPPRIGVLDYRTPAAVHSSVPGADERARLYSTQRWAEARRRFLEQHPLCEACDARDIVNVAVVVDHRDGHRGDWLLRFWNEDGWQALCETCHNLKSAKELAEWRGQR